MKKYRIFREKFKNPFSRDFDSETREKGFVFIPVIIGLLLLVDTLGVGAAVVWTWKKEIATSIIGGILTLTMGVARGCAQYAGEFFQSVASSTILQQSITHQPIVTEGWAICRDFANMFVVLGFVVVGIATILRIREYEAQKTLLPLIIVALLINFSTLFCGIVIDASNMGMNYFLDPATGPGTGATAIVSPLIIAVTDPTLLNGISEKWSNSKTDPQFNFIVRATGYCITTFLIAMIFFIYGILFLFRHVALMMLVILSPLGFVCYAFPATHGIYKKWWEQFMQWSIIGIPAGFFMYLGAHLMQNLTNTVGTGVGTGIDIAFFIPAGFLLFAYTLIFQTSALGASAAIGLATGAAGFAYGATKGTVKWAGKTGANAAWNSRPAQAAKNAAGRAMENLGVPGFKVGATAAKTGAKMKDPEGRYGALIAEGNLAQAQRAARGETMMGRFGSPIERGGAISALLKSNNLDFNNAKEVAGLRHFQEQGGNLGEYAAKDPRLAGHNISLRRKTMQEINPDTMTAASPAGRNYTEAEANEKNVANSYSRIGPRNMEQVAFGAMNENFFRHVKTKTIAKAADLGNFTDKQTDNIQKYITPGTDEHKKLYKLQADLRASGKIDEADRIRENVKAASMMRGDEDSKVVQHFEDGGGI